MTIDSNPRNRANDDATMRLHEYLARLAKCSTTGERDVVLKDVREDVATIISSAAHLEQHWLLKLDGINRRFCTQERRKG